MSDYYELIDALDGLRAARDSWDRTRCTSGFYDPCGSIEEHAKEDIAKAEDRVDAIFFKLVQKHAPPCQCPSQPLG